MKLDVFALSLLKSDLVKGFTDNSMWPKVPGVTNNRKGNAESVSSRHTRLVSWVPESEADAVLTLMSLVGQSPYCRSPINPLGL